MLPVNYIEHFSVWAGINWSDSKIKYPTNLTVPVTRSPTGGLCLHRYHDMELSISVDLTYCLSF